MLIYTAEGCRTIDDRDVLTLYRDRPDGSPTCNVTLALASGEEVSGRARIAAVTALQTKLIDTGPAAA